MYGVYSMILLIHTARMLYVSLETTWINKIVLTNREVDNMAKSNGHETTCRCDMCENPHIYESLYGQRGQSDADKFRYGETDKEDQLDDEVGEAN